MTKDYQILCSSDMNGLIDDVKAQIKKGWQPVGGVAMAQEAANPPGTPKPVMHYAQALVMKKKQ